MKVSDVIQDAKYLFDFQKVALLGVLEENNLGGEIRGLTLRTFLDEFFRRVLNIGSVEDKLDANESAELDRLIEELK